MTLEHFVSNFGGRKFVAYLTLASTDLFSSEILMRWAMAHMGWSFDTVSPPFPPPGQEAAYEPAVIVFIKDPVTRWAWLLVVGHAAG